MYVCNVMLCYVMYVCMHASITYVYIYIHIVKFDSKQSS